MTTENPEPVTLAAVTARLTALAERGRQAENAIDALSGRAQELDAVRAALVPVRDLTAAAVVDAARRAWAASLATEAALTAEAEGLRYDLGLRRELTAAWARGWLVCERTTVGPADGWFTAMAESRDRVRAWGEEMRQRLAAAEQRWRPDAPQGAS